LKRAARVSGEKKKLSADFADFADVHHDRRLLMAA
jgi:hypothetical protein